MFLRPFYKSRASIKHISSNILKNRCCSFSTVSTTPTKITTLSNGIKVATEKTYHPTATVGVYFDVGSAYETPENNGTAHFLEHLAFKGTRKRSKLALESEIETMGASLNAYTSRESTSYQIKVFSWDVSKAIEILSDILLNSLFHKSSIEDERSTILREMEEVSKSKEEVLYDHVHALAFKECSLGLTILGSADMIKSITRDQIIQYVNSFYTGNRMLLVAAGGVEHDQVVSLTDAAFKRLSQGIHVPRSSAIWTGGLKHFTDPTMTDTYFGLVFPSSGYIDEEMYTALIFVSIVGGYDRSFGNFGVLSPICQTVANLGLVHRIQPFQAPYHYIGMVGLTGVTTHDKVKDLIYQLIQSLKQFSASVSERTLLRAKVKIKNTMQQMVDGTSGVCEDIARQINYLGKRHSIAECLEIVDKTDLPRLNNFLQKLLKVEPVIVTLGPVDALPSMQEVDSWLASNPQPILVP